MNRKTFITQSTLGLSSVLVAPKVFTQNKPNFVQAPISKSFALATWNVTQATTVAGEALEQGVSAIEAVVEGVAVEEANILNTTVGKGGAPDREGNVTLDACVMDATGNCGAVLAVENITHVASLAKAVMEQTPHVILVGEGARKFALEHQQMFHQTSKNVLYLHLEAMPNLAGTQVTKQRNVLATVVVIRILQTG